MAEISRLDLEGIVREMDEAEAEHLDYVAARNSFIEDGGNPDEIMMVERLFGLT